MTNEQLYTLLAPGILAVFGVFFGAWTTNKRLDDMNGRLDRVNTTMDAMRQDISDIKRDLRGHDVEIKNLKDQVKAQ